MMVLVVKQPASQHGHSYWEKWKSILPKNVTNSNHICCNKTYIWAQLNCMIVTPLSPPHTNHTCHYYTLYNIKSSQAFCFQPPEQHAHIARLKVLTVLLFSIQVFCDIMPHGWASGSWCSSSALKMWYAYHWCYADSRLVALREI